MTLPRIGSAVTVMPRAIVFDTFGTVVDWRGSIIEEGKAYAKRKGFELDWGDFADRWRAVGWDACDIDGHDVDAIARAASVECCVLSAEWSLAGQESVVRRQWSASRVPDTGRRFEEANAQPTIDHPTKPLLTRYLS